MTYLIKENHQKKKKNSHRGSRKYPEKGMYFFESWSLGHFLKDRSNDYIHTHAWETFCCPPHL